MEISLPNEELWEAFERLKAENYHLKRQLKNKNNLINGKDKYIKKLEREVKEWKPQKNHYKNGKRSNYKVNNNR
jgi:prefoldin subunit 5